VQLVKDLELCETQGAISPPTKPPIPSSMTAPQKDVRPHRRDHQCLDGSACPKSMLRQLNYADAKSVATEFEGNIPNRRF